MKLKKIISLLLTTIICTSFIPAYASTTDKTWITDDVWISGELDMTITDMTLSVKNTISTNDYQYIKDLYANATVLVAGYNDNKFIGCETLDCSFQPEFSFNLSDITSFSLDKVNKIKAFLWDETGNLKPFCNSTTKILDDVNNTNYCLITRLWISDDNSYKVEIINQYGQKLEYSVANETETAEIASLLGLEDSDEYSFSYDDFKLNPSKSAVIYSLTNNKFTLESGITPANSSVSNLKYEATSTKLSEFRISKETTIINLTNYLADKRDSIYTSTLNEFEDGNLYSAYLYNKNSDGIYTFVIITDGMNKLNAASPIAIVKQCDGTATVGTNDGYKYMVFYDGIEDTLYTDANLVEGDIIMYSKTSSGWVNSDMIKTVFDMTETTTYETMMNLTLAGMLTPSHINNSKIRTLSHAGIVGNFFRGDNYGCTEILKDFDNGISNLNQTTELDTYYSGQDINTYVYNFEKPKDSGIRVEPSPGYVPPNYNLFRPIMDDTYTEILWADAKIKQVCPHIIIARAGWGEIATDVFYFIGDWDY